MGKKSKRVGVVYSTNDKYDYDYEPDEEQQTLQPSEQQLYVSIDRKQRAGKEVTLVEGFVGTADDLKELGKQLKQACGTGGSVKDGQILVQGNCRDKVCAWLDKAGYRYKRKGG